MQQGTSGRPGSSIQLNSFTICVAFGALLIASAVLQAILELEDGGDYAFWSALIVLARVSSLGVLVLLCALHLGQATWGDGLRRATPLIGAAVAVAAVAVTLYDISEGFGETVWVILNDLFYYVPVTLAAAVYLSAPARTDRVLGSPSEWGRYLAVIALVAALAITIDDVSDAGGDEFWVFLSSFALMGGLALFLLAVCLEPAVDLKRPSGGQLNVAEVLNDARMPDWLAIGGVAVVVAGLLLGFEALDAPSDGFWLLLQQWGFYLGLGAMILIASGGQVGGIVRGDHPYLRYALIAGLVAMFLAGLKFAADADSDNLWVFLSDAIEYPAFLAVAFAMFEARRAQDGAGA